MPDTPTVADANRPNPATVQHATAPAPAPKLPQATAPAAQPVVAPVRAPAAAAPAQPRAADKPAETPARLTAEQESTAGNHPAFNPHGVAQFKAAIARRESTTTTDASGVDPEAREEGLSRIGETKKLIDRLTARIDEVNILHRQGLANSHDLANKASLEQLRDNVTINPDYKYDKGVLEEVMANAPFPGRPDNVDTSPRPI